MPLMQKRTSRRSTFSRRRSPAGYGRLTHRKRKSQKKNTAFRSGARNRKRFRRSRRPLGDDYRASSSGVLSQENTIRLPQEDIVSAITEPVEKIFTMDRKYRDYEPVNDLSVQLSTLRKSFDDTITSDVEADAKEDELEDLLLKCIYLLGKPDVLMDGERTKDVLTLFEHMLESDGFKWPFIISADTILLERWDVHPTSYERDFFSREFTWIIQYILFLLKNRDFGKCLEFMHRIDIKKAKTMYPYGSYHKVFNEFWDMLEEHIPNLVMYEAKQEYTETQRAYIH